MRAAKKAHSRRVKTFYVSGSKPDLYEVRARGHDTGIGEQSNVVIARTDEYRYAQALAKDLNRIADAWAAP